MQVTATHRYSADVDSVFSAFSKPAFYKKKFAAVGAQDVEVVESKKRGKTFYIHTRRDVPSDVPGVLKKFLGEWNTIEQTEEWEEDGDGYVNELEISSESVPATITGSMHLEPTAKGCVNRLEFEIDCSIPFVGGKLEAFIAKDMERVLKAEYAFIKQYLAG